jgi:hypothetical protein
MSAPFEGSVRGYTLQATIGKPVHVTFDVAFTNVYEAEAFRDFVMANLKLPERVRA